MSDWQSCLATVSVLPERGRELSAVSTEQRRQILIFYLSIIFVFHGKGKCVFVCEWASAHIWCMCLSVGLLSIYFPLAYDWGNVTTPSVCTLLLLHCCCSKSIPGQWTQQSIYSLHCSLIGWKLAGGRKHAFVCLYAACALLWISVFVCIKSNFSRHLSISARVSDNEEKLLAQLCTFCTKSVNICCSSCE